MTPSVETPGRDWVFVLDMAADVELLMRALAPFPTMGAQVKRLNLQTDGGISRLEIQALGLQNAAAERLGLAFRQMSGVRHVSFGSRPFAGERTSACVTRRLGED